MYLILSFLNRYFKKLKIKMTEQVICCFHPLLFAICLVRQFLSTNSATRSKHILEVQRIDLTALTLEQSRPDPPANLRGPKTIAPQKQRSISSSLSDLRNRKRMAELKASCQATVIRYFVFSQRPFPPNSANIRDLCLRSYDSSQKWYMSPFKCGPI
jgi:hypothetical protein